MTYISDQQFEQISLDSLLSTNIPSLKGKSRLTVHDQHAICVSAALCLCIHNPFQLVNQQTDLNATCNEHRAARGQQNVVFFFNFPQSVLKACRTEELVREERHYIAA